MTGGGRYLMVITKNKSSIILDCPDLSLLDNWQSKVEANMGLFVNVLQWRSFIRPIGDTDILISEIL